jgi:hypothetical protein
MGVAGFLRGYGVCGGCHELVDSVERVNSAHGKHSSSLTRLGVRTEDRRVGLGHEVDVLPGPEEFRVLQQNPARLGVHLDIAHQVGIGVFGPRILQLAFDLLALATDLSEFFGLRLDRGCTAPAASASTRRGRRLLSLLGNRQSHAENHRRKGRKSFHF